MADDGPRRRLSERIFSPLHAGSLRSGILVLSMTAIGSGILTLPFVLRELGWALGTFLIVTFGVLNITSLEILLEAGAFYGSSSFAELLLSSYGRAAENILELFVFLDCWGAIVAYFIFIGQMLPSLLNKVLVSMQVECLAFDKFTVVPVLSVFVFGVSLPRSINAISSLSLLGVVSIVYLILILLSRAISASSHELLDLPAVRIQGKGEFTGATNACALIIFSFLCQCNIFPVYCDIERQTVGRMRKLTRRSTLFQITCYSLTALAGFKSFGEATQDNIFLSLPEDNVWYDVARFMLCVSLCLAIPLNIFPTRSSFLTLMTNLGPGRNDAANDMKEALLKRPQMPQGHMLYSPQSSPMPFLRTDSPASSLPMSRQISPMVFSRQTTPSPFVRQISPLPFCRGVSEADPGASAGDMQDKVDDASPGSSWLLHVSLSALIVVSTVMTAFALPSISFVMGAIGGIAGVAQMYVLPGLVLWKCRHIRSPAEVAILLVCYTLATLIGVVSVVLSFM